MNLEWAALQGAGAGVMRERPILFSAPMVRAILSGEKTQTRRIAKPKRSIEPMTDECPHGLEGDRLWVRETWGLNCWMDDGAGAAGSRPSGLRVQITYEADHAQGASLYPGDPGYPAARGLVRCYEDEFRKRPSIHMPRWASRITLEITDVRVERLQDISNADARGEGVAHWRDAETLKGLELCSAYRYEFEDMWSHMFGRDSWNVNPWVWALTFRRVEQPA